MCPETTKLAGGGTDPTQKALTPRLPAVPGELCWVRVVSVTQGVGVVHIQATWALVHRELFCVKYRSRRTQTGLTPDSFHVKQ